MRTLKLRSLLNNQHLLVLLLTKKGVTLSFFVGGGFLHVKGSASFAFNEPFEDGGDFQDLGSHKILTKRNLFANADNHIFNWS